jgi:cation diffusion facilitator family transporter
VQDYSLKKRNAAKLSVISNTSLVILKMIAGVLTGSIGIISEAIHSGVDLAASVIAYYSIKMASLPADEDHKFGHGKYEDVSGLAEAILIFVVAFLIIQESMHKLLDQQIYEIQTTLGIVVMLFSTIVNIVISTYLFRVAKETDSMALYADAQHLRTDVFTSLGVLFSLIIIKFTGMIWVDAATAVVIGLIIAYMAFAISKKAFGNLVDISLPPEEEEKLREIICKYEDEIISIHKFRTRKAGAERFIEFHLMIEANLTIREGHLLTELIEADIKKEFPTAKISIHMEPCTEECEECHLTEVDPDSCKKYNKRKSESGESKD